MTQEEKQLLIKDLCARLLYKTYVKTAKGIGYAYAINTSQLIELSVANDSKYWSEVFNIEDVKPYLRSKASMTEEEIKKYQSLQDTACSYHYEFGDIVDDLLYFDNDVSLDYLNSIHIDYRGLIPMGLALEASKEMYKTE